MEILSHVKDQLKPETVNFLVTMCALIFWGFILAAGYGLFEGSYPNPSWVSAIKVSTLHFYSTYAALTKMALQSIYRRLWYNIPDFDQ